MPGSTKRISIIGSGNWGSTIGKIIGNNVLAFEQFENEVLMWVFEETVNGRKLTEIINSDHVNVKYLDGIKLPNNLIAEPDLVKCTKNADILVFVLPHQFLLRALNQMKPHVKSTAQGVSLIKGLSDSTDKNVTLLTDVIRNTLSIECAVLMGANLAGEVAKELFCESTVASKNKAVGQELKLLFQTDYFRISCIEDEVAAELCGALKNIVAVGAGMADGLGYGDNTKAAIIRLGFMEMKKFINEFFSDRNPQLNTFLQSCGMADLITTCYGGRNKKIGINLVKSDRSVAELETTLLNGQSAQGPLTAGEVFQMLDKKGKLKEYPLFVAIHEICVRKRAAKDFIDCLRNHPEHQ